jgi:pimeloyl-ACP methyl ester carboxylesterase
MKGSYAMIRKALQRALFLLLIAGILAGCGLPAAAPVPTAAPSPTAKPAINLAPCELGGQRALCGTLRVYENRQAQSGRTIDLRVAVIKASGPNPAPDPIFYLAGGPGVAATEDAAKSPQFPGELYSTHDLVFVDQRGTGGSHRVVIPPSPDTTGLTEDQAMKKISEWVPQMLQGLDADPQYYTTSVAMDDLDEVRAALGYDKIDLFGHSYGATAAQYYLRQHPDHVRAVILSGGALLDVPVFERWMQNGQHALDLTFARCEAEAACHKAFPQVRLEFTSLLGRLEVQPVTDAFTHPGDQKPVSITYTHDLFAEIVRVMTLDANNASRLPRLIHKAYAENDWRGFSIFTLKYGPGDWGDQIMERVIRCSEKWASFKPDEVARLGAGTYLEGWYNQLAYIHSLACQLTPKGYTPEGMDPQPGSQVPVLLINGEADPQDPPANVAGAKALWPNSLSLVEPYQGHWLSDSIEIGCRWSIEAEFIAQGSVDGLHTDCLKSVQPPAFAAY